MSKLATCGRRDFIRTVGAFGAMSVFAGCGMPGFRGSPRPKLGLQLYSIHKIFWQSPERILEELAAAGYEGVEFYDYHGKSGAELRRMCEAAGLKAFGSHLNGDVALVGDELAKTLDFAAEAGFESLVTPHAQRDSADEYRRFGRTMGQAAEAAKRYGIRVGVHSTYHHFTTRFGEETAWDLIYREASPLLYQQVDTGNTFNTGYDVVGLLRRFRGRNFSTHLKENVPTIDGVLGVPPTDGGSVVPWAGVIGALKNDPDNRWWIVEAEGRPDSLEPAKKCLGVIRGWL